MEEITVAMIRAERAANRQAKRLKVEATPGDAYIDGRMMARCICRACSKEFYARKADVLKGRAGHFCSKRCSGHADKNYFRYTPESTRKERVRANGLITMRVRRGLLVRPTECEQCHKICRPDAHHEDYKKPDQVEWLCRSCHMKRHNHGKKK